MLISRIIFKRGRLALLAGVAACLLTSCMVPDADDSIDQASNPETPNAAASSGVATAPTAGKTPTQGATIEGAAGPLSPTESRALIAKIGDEAGDSDILRRHLAIEEDVADSPLTTGNAVSVLRDGPETFKAISAAIRSARHNLNLEYYTIEDIHLDNGAGGSATLSDLLVAARQAGVAVNVIYDSYGSSDTPAAFFTKLEQAGVNLLGYHPITPTNPVNALTINDRDHRKILVADGVVGVVGGVNLSTAYESKSPGSDKSDDEEEDGEEDGEDALAPTSTVTAPSDDDDSKGADPVAGIGETLGLATALPDEWRDTAVRLEGPAVAELQALFRDHWNGESDTPLTETGLFPEPAAKGNQVVRIIGSTPDDDIPRYYVTLISSLRNAESRAWISAAYFVPTPEQKEELINAAERGVDVRLLLADSSDAPIAIEAARTHYSDLLEAGVKIYETSDVVMHAKTVVIDGVWSAIGSSNFDYRSVLYNDEVEAIVLGAETASELETVFTEGMAIATEIDSETWEEDRPLDDRMKGFFSRMWEHLL